MEQLIYYLNHTANASDQWLGVFNFVLVFIIIPTTIGIGVLSALIKIILYFINRKRNHVKR
jgi:hypothetical protein